MFRRMFALTGAFLLLAVAPAQKLIKGGPVGVHVGPESCIPSREFARLRALVMAHQGSIHPKLNPAVTFGFFPQGGTLWQDLFVNNFCDMEPTSPAYVDYDGTGFTYDGHNGHDSDILGFDEQTIGVPIFAVKDGTVLATADGNFDRNTFAANQPANYVIIDNGNGLSTWYWHMKSGSVLVQAGAIVRAGQQIGSTGSSGASTAPHLHFTAMQDGVWFEPSSGPMRPGASNWLNQLPIQRQTYLADFNCTGTNPASWPGRPFEWPRIGTFLAGPFNLWNLVDINNLPAFSTFRLVLKTPAGAIAIDSGTQSFNNFVAYRRSNWVFGWNLFIPTPGQWTIQLYVNDVFLRECPFTVVSSPVEIVNRAPYPVTAQTDPITPALDAPVFCRILGDQIFDDPDYDVIRYRYQWMVDGNIVRDVTTAGRADCIPVGALNPGHSLTCTVTPFDGFLYAPAAPAVVRLAPGSLVHTRGTLYSGSVQSLQFSDDVSYVAERGVMRSRSLEPIQFIVSSTSYSPTTTGLTLTLESRVSNPNLAQAVALFDYVLNDWVTVDDRPGTLTDATITVQGPGPASRYIGPAGAVKARISYRVTGGIADPSWFAYVDQMFWSVTP